MILSGSREWERFTTLIKERKRVHVFLDWQAYFRAFDELHGGDPVVHGGRLLYRDGFTHSMTDYRGPEWPPPTDLIEKVDLILFYWRRRREIIAVELKSLEYDYDGLTSAQSMHSAPLQQVVRFFDPDNGKYVTERGPLDLTAVEGRLGFLRDELRECNSSILTLEHNRGQLEWQRSKRVAGGERGRADYELRTESL